MMLAVIFFIELCLLFFISNKFIKYLGLGIYHLTHSKAVTVNLLAIIFLPGTIIHELAHILIAGIMLVPVGEINVLPEIEGDQVKLGTAQIGQTDPLRRLIIGIAPLILGLGIIFSVFYLSQDNFLLLPLWQKLAILLIVFEITNTMFSSSKDLEGALALMVAILIIIGIILAVLYLTNSLELLNRIRLPDLNIYFQKAIIFLTIPFLIELSFYLLARLLVRKHQL